MMNNDHNSSSFGLTRRRFAQALGLAGIFGLVERQTLVRVLAESKQHFPMGFHGNFYAD
jgi:hypothetical protein